MNVEVKVSGFRDIDGEDKMMKDLYLAQATSIVDAIAKITEAESLAYADNFEVIAAKVTNYSAFYVADENVNKYYKVKLNIIEVDQYTAKERKTPTYWLVQAETLDHAKKRIEEELRTFMADVELGAISETKLLDYVSE